ncbi:MAG: UDP-glucose:undecaprenyl-phosphate glucose-1-phosphate transferase [Fimbriimonadaceae bacterium]|nr:UDP-glucose:undecaprenyl-phosphate glucose-1-phosphate transferase [Fimbriimonadaceae bacterium]
MYAPFKRLLDLVLATLVLLILGLPMLIIAAIIRKDGGPALYRGKRVGLEGKSFDMLKFRSMVMNADKIGASSTGNDDPRITRIGHFIRRYKVDELAQFLNVLKGEMSVVGPRPQVQWAVDLYTEEERQILSVRPGITDFASLWARNEGEILDGSPDPDADYLRLIAPEKTRLALYYVRHMSLWNDLKIVVATAFAAFLKRDPSWCLPDGTAPQPTPVRLAAVSMETETGSVSH